MTRLNPQLIIDVNIENDETRTTAPRGVLGTLASLRITACTGGEDATAKPLSTMSAICIVNASRLQKPSPRYRTNSWSSLGDGRG
jgi:hypothetical protein